METGKITHSGLGFDDLQEILATTVDRKIGNYTMMKCFDIFSIYIIFVMECFDIFSIYIIFVMECFDIFSRNIIFILEYFEVF